MSTVSMAAVRKVIADEATRQFDSLKGVETRFHDQTLYVETNEEHAWERTRVTLNLYTDLYGEYVEEYYVNTSSGWMTADKASTLAVLLGGVSAVAKKVEEMGVKYHG